MQALDGISIFRISQSEYKHLNQNFTGACYLQRGHLVRIGKKMNNSF